MKFALPVLLLAFHLHAGVESRLIRAGDVRLHYADWGGAGEPLIFIPGGCDTAFVFGDTAEILARSFRVVGLTARGCGASDRPGSGYDMAHQVADIAGFMDALGIVKATLLGHSSGGGKITQFAKTYPARVHRLIYLDTVYRYVAPGLEEKIDAAIAAVLGRSSIDPAGKRRRTAQMWEPGAWSPAMERNFQENLAVQPDPGWRPAVDRDMQAGLYFDTQIAHPALLIFAMDTDRDRARQFDRRVRGELGPLIQATEQHRREDIRRFRSNGNHVRVVEMRHTAHYCFAQRPVAVSRLIVSFLRQ